MITHPYRPQTSDLKAKLNNQIVLENKADIDVSTAELHIDDMQ